MSQPENSKKSSKKAAKGNPVVDWVVRGVVFGVLGILLILALLDFRAKQSATSTAEAWRSALRAKGETSDLTKSEFSQIAVKGGPEITSAKAGPNGMLAVTVDTYVWKGTFRTYTVKVYFGLGNDPTVEQIEGPGEADPAT
jgi:hypothetical protein